MLRSIPLILITVLTFGHVIMAEDDLRPALLEEALWEGELNVRVEGPIYSQILENELGKNGVPTGFIKEKGSMKVDYTMTLRFQVNALGDFTLVGATAFRARQILDSEYWHHFQEEVEVDKGVMMPRRVKVSEITSWVHEFDVKERFDQDSIEIGTIRFAPDGRMDKKGALTIHAEFRPEFKGRGKVSESKERQPAVEDFNKQTEGPSGTTWEMPFSFEVTIQHRKEAVRGSFDISVQANDPFTMSNRKRKSSDVFNANLKAGGSYSLRPLFGKK